MNKRGFITALTILTLALSALFITGASAAVYSLGDVSGDGRITSADARLALRCAAKLERLSEARTLAADADRSGKVNSSDARILLRVAAKLETLDVFENDVFEEPDVVRELSFSAKGVCPISACSAGGGLVAVCCGIPSEESSETYDVFEKQQIYMIDVKNDKLIDVFEQPEEQCLYSVRKNGQFLSFGPRDDTTLEMSLYLSGDKMRTVKSFRIPFAFFLEDEENDGFYFTRTDSKNTLERMTFDGRCETIVKLSEDSDIQAYAPDTGIVAALQPSAYPFTAFDLLLYDVSGNGAVSDHVNCVYQYSLAKDFFVGENLYYPEEDRQASEIVNVIGIIPTSGEGTLRFLQDSFSSFYTFFDRTAIAFSAETDYIYEKKQFAFSDICLTDLESGRKTEPLVSSEEFLFLTAEYVPETDRILVAGSVEADDGSITTRFYTLDPSAADYTKALEPFTIPEPAAPRPVSPGWEDLRAKADAIERDFGVTVKIGDQVLDEKNNWDYTLFSLEKPDPERAWTDPLEETDLILDTLRRGLSEYPDGFFRQFKNSRGQGGMRILLARAIRQPIDGTYLGGYSENSGAWFNIGLSAGRMFTTDALHHEIWHAAELYIAKKNTGAFSDDAWQALNPPGFRYTVHLHATDDYDYEPYLIPSDCDPSAYDNVWFAYMYSTTNGQEDRATLIETLTSEYYYSYRTGFDDPRDWFVQMPHLQVKLDYMAEQSRKVFGCVYWDTILDRRYKEPA